MTEDELIELIQSGDAERITAVLDRINGIGATDPAFVRAADRFWEANDDLRDEPEIHKAVLEFDKKLARDYPNARYEDRLDVVAQAARKRYGTVDQRAIRAMKLQRNPNLKPEDLDYVPEESATEFDQEHDAGISEAIEQMRKSRAGTPLSEIRRRRPGMAPAETDGEA